MYNISHSPSEKALTQINREEKYFIRREKNVSELNTETLELIVKKLNLICEEYDPFANSGSENALQFIKEYSLEDYREDPFTFTNQLLKLNTDAQEELRKRLN